MSFLNVFLMLLLLLFFNFNFIFRVVFLYFFPTDGVKDFFPKILNLLFSLYHVLIFLYLISMLNFFFLF